MRYRVFFLLALLLPIMASAQMGFSFKPVVVGYHPYSDPNNYIAPNRIGSDGTFAQEPGVILGFEQYLLKKRLGYKINGGFFKDNGDKSSALLQLAARVRSVSGNQSITLSIGPSFFMRKPWNDVENYTTQLFWDSGSNWDTKIVWLSGELEMLYAFTPEHRINFSFNHLAPRTYTFTVGYSYWIEPPRNQRKSNYSGKKTSRRRR